MAVVLADVGGLSSADSRASRTSSVPADVKCCCVVVTLGQSTGRQRGALCGGGKIRRGCGRLESALLFLQAGAPGCGCWSCVQAGL